FISSSSYSPVPSPHLHSFPTRRSSDLAGRPLGLSLYPWRACLDRLRVLILLPYPPDEQECANRKDQQVDLRVDNAMLQPRQEHRREVQQRVQQDGIDHVDKPPPAHAEQHHQRQRNMRNDRKHPLHTGEGKSVRWRVDNLVAERIAKLAEHG